MFVYSKSAFIDLVLDNSSVFYDATSVFDSRVKCWLVLWELPGQVGHVRFPMDPPP